MASAGKGKRGGGGRLPFGLVNRRCFSSIQIAYFDVTFMISRGEFSVTLYVRERDGPAGKRLELGDQKTKGPDSIPELDLDGSVRGTYQTEDVGRE